MVGERQLKTPSSLLFCCHRCCLVTKLFLILWDPVDCSLPDSSVYGISQARILEWVTISFSKESSLPRDRTYVSSLAGRFFTIWATWEAHPKFTDKEIEAWRDCHMSTVTHLTWTQGDLSGREIGLDLMSSGLRSWAPLWWKRRTPSHTWTFPRETRKNPHCK